jgi:hypothetical protein
MALLTITEAARVTGVSRVTLHRYIKAGKLSRTGDGTIDTAELLRAGFVLQPATFTTDTADTPVLLPATSPVTPAVTSPDLATLQHLITVLQRELDAAHAREEAARERETRLLQMLQQMQHRYDRLLDMPRPTAQDAPHAPPPPSSVHSHPPRQDAPASPPDATDADPRGAMRRRIVALLQEHPEGLTPAAIRDLLGVERSLADTLLGMLRYGLVQRVERGKYVATEFAHTTESHRS